MVAERMMHLLEHFSRQHGKKCHVTYLILLACDYIGTLTTTLSTTGENLRFEVSNFSYDHIWSKNLYNTKLHLSPI